jgi:hypothetical protein
MEPLALAEGAVTTIIMAASGAVIAAVLSVAIVHPGATVGTRLLGRDRCLDPDSVNGCLPWFAGSLLSVATILLLEDRVGWWALLASPAGPVVATLLVVLQLRFSELGHRRTEFVVKDGTVMRTDGTALMARCVLGSGAYCCTGPGGGYVLYTITLHDGDLALASNGYVSGEAYERDMRLLTDRLGLLAIDLDTEWQCSGTEWWSVSVGKEWAVYLVRSLEQLPPRTREFWLSLTLGRLGAEGFREVLADDLSGHLAEVETRLRAADTDPIDSRVRADIVRLRRLLQMSGGGMMAMRTSKASVAASEARRKAAGGTATVSSFEHSIAVHRVFGARDAAGA